MTEGDVLLPVRRDPSASTHRFIADIVTRATTVGPCLSFLVERIQASKMYAMQERSIFTADPFIMTNTKQARPILLQPHAYGLGDVLYLCV